MDLYETNMSDEPDNDRARIGGNNPPDPISLIDPENLIDVEILPAVLRHNYPGLTDRRDALVAAIGRWITQHTQPKTSSAGPPARPVITDEIDAGATADFLKQLATFAGPQGEVEQTRQRVKRKPFDAGKAIDAYFSELRSEVVSGLVLIQQAATAYVLRKEDEERQRRIAAAKAAAEEADRLAKLTERRDAPSDADDLAVLAEEKALAAQAAIDAPLIDAGRVRSDMGTTLSGRSTWKVRVTSMQKLAGAVARGDLSTDWITLNESVAGALVRGKAGKRNKDLPPDCGITIEEVRNAR